MGGSQFQLRRQPANSPDLNVLDLGFFNAIQSLQYQTASGTIDDLIQAVQDAFNALPHEKLNDVFLTLQNCMEACMVHGGKNTYKTPRMKKSALKASGSLPVAIKCSEEAITAAKAKLNRNS